MIDDLKWIKILTSFAFQPLLSLPTHLYPSIPAVQGDTFVAYANGLHTTVELFEYKLRFILLSQNCNEINALVRSNQTHHAPAIQHEMVQSIPISSELCPV